MARTERPLFAETGRLLMSASDPGLLKVSTEDPISLSFLSTTQDLLDAYDFKVQRDASVRGIFRWFLFAFACLWFGGGLYGLIDGPDIKTGQPSRITSLFFAVSGFIVLWQQFGRTFLERRRIRLALAPQMETTIKLSADGIDVETPGGRVHKSWRSVTSYHRTGDGLMFEFGDVVHWIPKRAFSNAAEIQTLVQLVDTWLRS